MIQALIPSVVGLIGKLIDKNVKDKDQAELLKAKLFTDINNLAAEELKGAVQIITAEAQGESWLQRNWRPLTMLFLVGLVGAHWLGFTAPNIDEAEAVALLGIVKVGLGGYVVGRSAEKVMKSYKGIS